MKKIFCDTCGKEENVRCGICIGDLTFDICEDCKNTIQAFFRRPQEAKKVIDIYFQSQREICEKELLKAIVGDKK